MCDTGRVANLPAEYLDSVRDVYSLDRRLSMTFTAPRTMH